MESEAKRTSQAVKEVMNEMYVPGRCFICKEATENQAYAHFSCCIAWADKKENLLKEKLKQKS